MKIKILILFNIIFMSGCLNDDNIQLVNFELDDEARVLHYFESRGDYANSEYAPGLISASAVYNQLQNYFIIDIQEIDQYSAGHIENSFNVPTYKLYEITDSLNSLNSGKKIIIVCKNGQASAYFTCLLRMAGLNNVFSLNFGMAYWNNDFAGEWLNAIGDNDALYSYDNINYPKLPYTELPKYSFPPILVTTEEKALFRIKEVIRNGFKSEINFTEDFDINVKSSHLKICYGKEKLYNYLPRDLGTMGHTPGTIWYSDYPNSDFRSTESLQTLPSDQPILIYSGNGQSSSCMVAYLTILGYNVKTLIYGANQLFYSRIRLDPSLVDEAFKSEDIMNYPYVTGN